MTKISVFKTTHFDFNFVNHVKNLRQLKKWSQKELSIRMGVSKTFVGNVESYTQHQKYSTRHIALLAKAFEFKNISELMEFSTPEHDKIKVTITQSYNDNGTKMIDDKILIEPI